MNRADSLLIPGDTCWRIDKADRVSFLVDGADYFAAVKQAMLARGASPGAIAMTLAEHKALAVAGRHPGALVIGCDQLLVCRMEDGRDRWFDKPADMAAARAQLQALRGKTHRLVTATVAWRKGARIWQDITSPRLTMRGFSDTFLDSYLAAEGEALLASVGGYRVEALGIHLFSRIEGEHSAILGLPMIPLLGFLRGHGALEG